MAQDLHHDPGMDVEIHEQCGAGAAGVVHGDVAWSGCGAAGGEVAVEVAGLDGVAVARGEYQVGAVPGVAGGGAPLSHQVNPTNAQGKNPSVRLAQWASHATLAT